MRGTDHESILYGDFTRHCIKNGFLELFKNIYSVAPVIMSYSNPFLNVPDFSHLQNEVLEAVNKGYIGMLDYLDKEVKVEGKSEADQFRHKVNIQFVPSNLAKEIIERNYAKLAESGSNNNNTMESVTLHDLSTQQSDAQQTSEQEKQRSTILEATLRRLNESKGNSKGV